MVPVTSERRVALSKMIQLFPILVESFRYRRWPLSFSSLLHVHTYCVSDSCTFL